MTTPTKGMEYVDVHKKWRYEAWHFTPWLAANLDVLSEVLGVKLELVQREAAVGPFFCDILAREVGSGEKVAIENQLELADHSHLGQLLTYAAGLDARVGIWVAPEFLYEHAEALHRLNKWTRDGLRFYAVKVKVMVTNSGNALEPRLCPVVTPDGWNKEITLPPGAVDSRKLQFHAFFQPITDKLCGDGFADKAILLFGMTGRRFPSGHPGVWYAASLESNSGAWVTLHIGTKRNDLTKRVFDKLMQHKEDIEARIATGPGQEWHWHKYPAYAFSSINIRRDGSIDDPPEKLEETRKWMLCMLPKLKEVFGPLVEDILKDLQGKSDS